MKCLAVVVQVVRKLSDLESVTFTAVILFLMNLFLVNLLLMNLFVVTLVVMKMLVLLGKLLIPKDKSVVKLWKLQLQQQ